MMPICRQCMLRQPGGHWFCITFSLSEFETLENQLVIQSQMAESAAEELTCIDQWYVPGCNIPRHTLESSQCCRTGRVRKTLLHRSHRKSYELSVREANCACVIRGFGPGTEDGVNVTNSSGAPSRVTVVTYGTLDT